MARQVDGLAGLNEGFEGANGVRNRGGTDERQSRIRYGCAVGAAVLGLAGCYLLIVDETGGTQALAETEDTGTVAVSDEGMKVAPAPDQEFRDQDCPVAPSEAKPSVSPGDLSIPANGITSSLEASEDLHLPAAPNGIIYSQSAPLGADEGNTVTAGHVDYAPNALSEQGGELSPWGYMHEVKACEHVYVADETGEVNEFVVTDKYVVGKMELEEAGVFAEDGEHKLVMVTCSGESVADSGGQFQFSYDHNLVLEAQEVSA